MTARLVGAFVVGCLALWLAPTVTGQDDKKEDKTALRFELFKDTKGEFRWKLMAANNKEIANSGEGYKDKADARMGIDLIQAEVAKPDKLTFDLYEDDKKEYRWRLKSANGQIVAVSGEGYKDKADAEKMIDKIKKEAGKAKVEDKA